MGEFFTDPAFDPHMPIEQRKSYLDMIRQLYEDVIDSSDRMKFLDDTFDADWPQNMNGAIHESLLAQNDKKGIATMVNKDEGITKWVNSLLAGKTSRL